MPIDVRQLGTCSVVRVGERFDVAFAGWLGHALVDVTEGNAATGIVIDLTEVSPVRPEAMAALWAAVDTGGIPVAVVNKRLSARRIMRRWGGSGLPVFPTVAMAVEALAPATRVTDAHPEGHRGFRHEAFLYAGADEFVEGSAPFITEALAADEPVLVAVSAAKIELLTERLGSDAARVSFADITELGRNPARILPAWLDFVGAHSGQDRELRGIGEPIWSGRTPDELVESQHHEALINVAFADSPAWWLLCPYDTASLAPEVVEAARRSHPMVLSGGVHRSSEEHLEDPWPAMPFEGPLRPPAGGDVAELGFDERSLPAVAGFAAREADRAGLAPEQVRDLARAVTEVATNSVRHGGGTGRVRMWREDGVVISEVHDAGHITDPLLGRVRPEHGTADRGVYLVNQLCDLVQIRSSVSDGTVVRLHVVPR